MPPIVTALYGALNAMLNLLLAYRVTHLRRRHRVSIGAGEAPELLVAIRAHANNAEYVPLALVILLVTELCGGASAWLHVLGGGLLLARVAHALGLGRRPPNPLRWGGTALTFTCIAVNAGYLLYLRFGI